MTLQTIVDMNLDGYSKALILASWKHAGVMDKGGHPYINHPIRVSLKCHGVMEKIVAILHDVVEDTDITFKDLEFLGFSQYIIDGVDAVTRRVYDNDTKETYEDFIDRCCTNDIGRAVKRADIADNTDPSRLHYLDKKFQNKLVTKYAKALATINSFEII